MSFLLEDSDRIYVGHFVETSEDQFSVFVTNYEEFFIEKLSIEVLLNRVNETNENIRFKQNKVLKTLKEDKPDSCTITNVGESIRMDLKFLVSSRPFQIYFLVSKCDPSEPPMFTSGLVKSLIENSLIISKMRKAIESKDLEIEEYKRNGGTLVRGKKEREHHRSSS